MKKWEEVKAEITSLDDNEKESIELLAEIISQMIEKRQEIGISQRELAEKCGIKQSAIARIESMRVVPQIDTLEKLLKPLGLKLAVVPDDNYMQQLSEFTNKEFDAGRTTNIRELINDGH